jgi:hypothetical protein
MTDEPAVLSPSGEWRTKGEGHGREIQAEALETFDEILSKVSEQHVDASVQANGQD